MALISVRRTWMSVDVLEANKLRYVEVFTLAAESVCFVPFEPGPELPCKFRAHFKPLPSLPTNFNHKETIEMKVLTKLLPDWFTRHFSADPLFNCLCNKFIYACFEPLEICSWIMFGYSGSFCRDFVKGVNWYFSSPRELNKVNKALSNYINVLFLRNWASVVLFFE